MDENVKCLLVDIDNVLISEVEEVPSADWRSRL